MTRNPADILRERLARTKRRQEKKVGGNGSSKENLTQIHIPYDTMITDNSLKDVDEPAKSKPKKVVAKKSPTKKAKPKKAASKKSKPKKAVSKPKRPPKKKVKRITKKVSKKKDRVFDRDRSGDGLRPIEREIIEAVANSDGNLGILEIAYNMFGPKCGSEGPNSVRTIRNAIRIPIRYGIIEHSSRGKLCVTEQYTKTNGDLKGIVDAYREQSKRAA